MHIKRKVMVLFGLLTLLIVLTACASAGEAPDITRQIDIHLGSGKKKLTELYDRKYTTYLTLRAGGIIEMDGKDKELSGVLIQYYERTAPCRVEVLRGDSWEPVRDCGTYLSEWVSFPAGITKARLVNGAKARLMLAELTVFGAGDKPARAMEWTETDKADLMLLVCHPDDELLWFGGLLPTYAGERGLRVLVVYTVPSTPNRRLELLDGLWHCGVTIYPQFLGMRDAHSYTLAKQYTLWRKSTLQSRITEVIRRYRPEVLVTHDLKGEYGHGGHRAVADCATACVSLAANPQKFADSAKRYGAWQVKKCYVHLLAQGQLQLDWYQPLSRFDGKDGMTVAKEALAFHRSQTANGWEMEEGGPCDNRLFGLFYTAVGEDEEKNDLMEHIDLSSDSAVNPVDEGIEVEEVLLDDEEAGESL